MIVPIGQEPADLKARMDTLFAKIDAAHPDKILIQFAKNHGSWSDTATEIGHKLGYTTGLQLIRGNILHPFEGNGSSKNQSSYELYNWNDFLFSVYCCYELTSIADRSIFQSFADAIIAVEWNHDVNYYSNIIESLSRDVHCYCIQVNTSDYGDSRITQPTKTEKKDILRTKGGANAAVLVGKIEIAKLREFQAKTYELQKDDSTYKPTPPNFNSRIAYQKSTGQLSADIIKELFT